MRVLSGQLGISHRSFFKMNPLYAAINFILGLWWIWLPILLFYIFFKSWLYYTQRNWAKKYEWILLEMRLPRLIEHSPKITEQIFTAFFTLHVSFVKIEKYLRGRIQDYLSLEIVGREGKIYFYIRIIKKYKNFIESHIYSRYPDAEINEVPDYVGSIPSEFPHRDFDLRGAVLKFQRPNPYPIRTYPLFIDVQSGQPFIDPLSNLLEVFSKMQAGEHVWFQILARPIADEEWKPEGKKIVNKLIERTDGKKKGVLKEEGIGWSEALKNGLRHLFTGTPSAYPEKAEPAPPLPSMLLHLTSDQKELVDAIEKKTSRKGFQCKIQFAYIAKKEVFQNVMWRAVMGALNQFTGANGFGLSKKYTVTRPQYLFKQTRRNYRKRILIKFLKDRWFWERGLILNVEELATIFHFPTITVVAPGTPYIESKKAAPPPRGLPI